MLDLLSSLSYRSLIAAFLQESGQNMPTFGRVLREQLQLQFLGGSDARNSCPEL